MAAIVVELQAACRQIADHRIEPPRQLDGQSVGRCLKQLDGSLDWRRQAEPLAGRCDCRSVADLGLNLRGFSAAAIGKKFICHLALDTEADAVRAAQAVRKL